MGRSEGNGLTELPVGMELRSRPDVVTKEGNWFMMTTRCVSCFIAVLTFAALSSASPKSATLDFTNGDKPDEKAQAFFMHMEGSVMGVPNASGEKVAESKQIYLRDVKNSHYIEGILRVGDVFLGVNGKLFEGNAVTTFRAAIAEAKVPGGKGSISINLWRDGVQLTVDVLALPPPPDLTRDGKPDSTPPWNLGPTGAKGWIFCRGLDTSESRQILVTEVDRGSPADRVLTTNDVILGIDGKLFEKDALWSFGNAVTEAEGRKGELVLLRWRDGERTDVTVQLKAMGRYSDTAPFKCGKSSRIVEEGCRSIVKRGMGDGIVGDINALALLASGNPEYLDAVKKYAHKVGPPDLKLKMEEGMYAWSWGYDNLFLTEYYLATKDKYVLPAIREFSTFMARGQGVTGTWGHGMRVPCNNGTLGGYGAVNQAGLICWMSLTLAQKCGIDDPDVRKAVSQSQKFFGFFAGKGCVPYGDHPAGGGIHDNNGTSGSVALCFDFIGDRAGASFYSRMATAAYGEKELGHTGNFFGYLWGPLGANRAGPRAVAAYMKELRGYYDAARRWDGSFATNNRNNYGWDMTGVFVLHYALPLQKLYITGQGVSKANALTGQELVEVMESGNDFNPAAIDYSYLSKSKVEIMNGLGNWSPLVRHMAATAVARRSDDPVPDLIRMLGSSNMNARYGACLALQYLEGRAAPATDDLIKLLVGDDLWLKIRAAFALQGIGQQARRAAPVMLKMAVVVDKNDPRATLCRYLNFALFKTGYRDNLPRPDGLLAGSLDGIDRELLYPAIKRMLTIDDGLCRTYTGCVLKTLSRQELMTLLPDLVKVAHDTAPSGEMFAQEIRVDSLRFLSANKLPDGLPAFVEYVRTQNGWGSRTIEILPLLKDYGSAARAVLPELKELHKIWKAQEGERKGAEVTRASVAEEVIKAIEGEQK
ncbi:MAG: DUF6288 domain-containing protein [bacterium]